MIRPPPRSTLFPYTTALPICFVIKRNADGKDVRAAEHILEADQLDAELARELLVGIGIVGDELHVEGLRQPKKLDWKSTRLNSSHGYISYAVFCLKKKNTQCS